MLPYLVALTALGHAIVLAEVQKDESGLSNEDDAKPCWLQNHALSSNGEEGYPEPASSDLYLGESSRCDRAEITFYLEKLIDINSEILRLLSTSSSSSSSSSSSPSKQKRKHKRYKYGQAVRSAGGPKKMSSGEESMRTGENELNKLTPRKDNDLTLRYAKTKRVATFKTYPDENTYFANPDDKEKNVFKRVPRKMTRESDKSDGGTGETFNGFDIYLDD